MTIPRCPVFLRCISNNGFKVSLDFKEILKHISNFLWWFWSFFNWYNRYNITLLVNRNGLSKTIYDQLLSSVVLHLDTLKELLYLLETLLLNHLPWALSYEKQVHIGKNELSYIATPKQIEEYGNGDQSII